MLPPIVKVLFFSRPVSFPILLPMVNPNTVVRRYLTMHSSLVSPFRSRTAAFDWYPAIIQHPSGITISAGDVIRLTVIAFSATSGKVKIENLTNGNTVSESLTSSVPLCLQSAEWLLEDFTPDVPPADFGTVTFIDAVAGGMAGTYTPSGCNVTLIDIEQNNTVLTSTTASGSSVTTKYV